jgi:hypothetical protein
MLCKAAQPPAGQESAFSPERISSQPCSPDGFTIRRKTGHWAVSFRFGQYACSAQKTLQAIAEKNY